LPAAFIFETVFQNMKQENVLNYRAHGRELSRAALSGARFFITGGTPPMAGLDG
jgi:hypothetical protein